MRVVVDDLVVTRSRAGAGAVAEPRRLGIADSASDSGAGAGSRLGVVGPVVEGGGASCAGSGWQPAREDRPRGPLPCVVFMHAN